MPTLGKPAEYDDVEATANARLAAQLPYVFAACRVAHYVHAILRDKFAGVVPVRERAQQWLQGWIDNYVESQSKTSESSLEPPRPLAAAEIVVEQMADDPIALTAKFYIRLNPDFGYS